MLLLALLQLLLLLLGCREAAAAQRQPPRLLSPADGATVYCARSGATPNFSWSAGAVPQAVDGLPDLVIEISTVETFPSDFTVTDAVPAILSRYVRADPLALVPQTLRAGYFWRVGVRSSGADAALVYSETRSFELRMPDRQVTIPAAETDWATIEAAVSTAAAAGKPYLVQFEEAARTIHPLAPSGTGLAATAAYFTLNGRFFATFSPKSRGVVWGIRLK